MIADSPQVLAVTPEVNPNVHYVNEVQYDNGNDSQEYASITMDAGGDFIVTWTQTDSSTQDENIYARKFDSMGGLLGMIPELDSNGRTVTVNGQPVYDPVFGTTPAAGSQETFGSAWAASNPILVSAVPAGIAGTTTTAATASVSADVEGDFVVAWSKLCRTPTSPQTIKIRASTCSAYDQYDDAEGVATLANTTAGGNQHDPSVAMAGQGQFYVSWTSNQGGGSEILMRPFNADGSYMNINAGPDRGDPCRYYGPRRRQLFVGRDEPRRSGHRRDLDERRLGRNAANGDGVYAQAYGLLQTRHRGHQFFL